MLVSTAPFARFSDPTMGKNKRVPVCTDWLEAQKAKWLAKHSVGLFEPFDTFEALPPSKIKQLMERTGKPVRKYVEKVARPYSERRSVVGQLDGDEANVIRDQVRAWAEKRKMSLGEAADFNRIDRKLFYSHINKYDARMTLKVAARLKAIFSDHEAIA